MTALSYTLIPLAAFILGAIAAALRPPRAGFVSAMQHLAAGVVFAAAAEILPQLMHQNSPTATLIGGAAGIALMLMLKAMEGRAKGPIVLLGAIAIDILVDGLVLGLGCPPSAPMAQI